jgi:ABC-2 type transport system ATP-binding protein
VEVVTTYQLQKQYSDGFVALKDLSLSIQKGEVYALIGPNGAGKSTAIKILTGLHRASGGSFSLFGREIAGNMDSLQGLIGYVPQDLIIYPHLSVKENLDLFASAYEIDHPVHTVEEMLELIQLTDFSKKRADKLSGGQKRRLNMAIGLLHQPRLLILDEPSSGMDPQSRNILWETIEKISKREDVTIILISHLLETVDRLADKIAIMDRGSVIAIGSPAELKNRYGSGDILEIVSKGALRDQDELVEALLQRLPESKITIQENQMQISSDDIYQSISRIMALVHSAIGRDQIKSVQIHETTLEDVFIVLTGRELREEVLN